jgi:hypothetical protein
MEDAHAVIAPNPWMVLPFAALLAMTDWCIPPLDVSHPRNA